MGEGSMGTAYGLTLAAPLGPLMKSLLVPYHNYCIVWSPKNTKMEHRARPCWSYFASVLSISTYGLTFERPSNYTPKLYGLIHCIRLEISLLCFPHPMPCFTRTPGKHINQSFLPSLYQLSLAVELVINCLQSLPRMPT
jgi:hypothetical protein